MVAENPFIVYSPEDLTVEEFGKLFVLDRNWINALESHKGVFIFGSRGSGKSMLLNYLEINHQLYYFEQNLENFFTNENPKKYIGIMVHLTRNNLDTNDYELLKKTYNGLRIEDLVDKLCLHEIILVIIYRILKTFIDSVPLLNFISSIDRKRMTNFCKGILKEYYLVDEETIYKGHLEELNEQDSNEKQINFLTYVFMRERELIHKFINKRLQLQNNINFERTFKTFIFLHNFICKFKELIEKKQYSFYILMDNGDDAKETLQLNINKLVSQRKNRDICFKIAVKKGVKWDMDKFSAPHDYSIINIDELYSSERYVYYERIKEIANKRLKVARISGEIEQFLPESINEKEKLEQIKIKLRKTYEKEYSEDEIKLQTLLEKKYKELKDPEITKNQFIKKRLIDLLPSKPEYVNNRVNKYAVAELFRSLYKTKKSYAGFKNIVHISSGIIRQFLEICARMYSEEVKNKGQANITEISLSTQNKVIMNYSNEFIDNLEEKIKIMRKSQQIVKTTYYNKLNKLIDSLGKYYKERLRSGEYLSEPRIFTFTLKDYMTSDQELMDILDLGVMENYFQFYWYSSKDGIGRKPGYPLNRRLCPRFGLDPTSFRGRIELKSEELIEAINTGRIPKYPNIDDIEDQMTLDEYFKVDEIGK